jgi:uncharacterized cupin superfamily protein
MGIERAIEFGLAEESLNAAPIYPHWILEGNPVARNRCLSTSADKATTTWMWDCTAGRFNWHYDLDETIYVVDGTVMVREHGGATCLLKAGDTAFFPAGSNAEWTVENYVRKVAFLYQPPPRSFLRQMKDLLKRILGRLGMREAAGGPQAARGTEQAVRPGTLGAGTGSEGL